MTLRSRPATRSTRRRRPALITGMVIAGLIAAVIAWWVWQDDGELPVAAPASPSVVATPSVLGSALASGEAFPPTSDQAGRLLKELTVAPNRGWEAYSRDAFGPGWSGQGQYPRLADGCYARDDVLRRDLADLRAGDRNPCIIFSGVLADPYTGATHPYSRYAPSQIEIDHVVPLGAAWRSGASQWTPDRRIQFANDVDNLLAVDKKANQDKSSKTPDQWRPRREFWCGYAERWVAIKNRYGLTVTAPEKTALGEMLGTCS